MKASGQIDIKSITLKHSDLKQLIDGLIKYLSQKKYRKVKSIVVFYGVNYKQEYSYDDFPEFQNFKEGLELIDINIESENNLVINITLSSNEVSPLKSFYSKIEVESDDRIITNGLLDEINSFFKKRTNIHYIFHSYGIFIAIILSILITYILKYYIEKHLLQVEIKNEYLFAFWFLISFPLKRYLRWLFPYIYFIDENNKKKHQRLFFYALLVSILAKYAFLFFNEEINNIF